MHVLSLGATRKPCNLSPRLCRDGEVAGGAAAPVWRRLLPPQPPGHRHGARRARARPVVGVSARGRCLRRRRVLGRHGYGAPPLHGNAVKLLKLT